MARYDDGLYFAPQPRMAFPFENLQVYKLSLDWAEQVELLCRRYKFEKVRDQLDHLGRMLTNLVKAHE